MEARNLTKTLYIPYEIFRREIYGALLLSNELVSRGWTVILGGKSTIFSTLSSFKLSPGIFFLKSIVPGETHVQDRLASYGHQIVSLDIEGLVPSKGATGVKLRYSKASIDRAKMIFFFGMNDYKTVTDIYPEAKIKSFITGSPVIDHLKNVRNTLPHVRNKKNILIATSCGKANALNGASFSRKMSQNAISLNGSEHELSELDHEALLDEYVFDMWKQIIPLISEEFPNVQITLRPHPSENVEFWKRYISRHKNVRLDDLDSINESLQKADVLLHFNSTSAIAAIILNVPPLMFIPPLPQEARSRITFVKDLSIISGHYSELFTHLRKYLDDAEVHLDITRLYDYCENLKPGNRNATQEIGDKIESGFVFSDGEFMFVRGNTFEKMLIYYRSVRRRVLWLVAIVCRYLKFDCDSLPPKNSYKYARAKQPKVSCSHLAQLSRELGISSNLRITELKRGVFLIKREK